MGRAHATKHLAEGRRWAIVHEWQRSGSVSSVCKACSIDKKTARRWIKRHQETGSVAAMPKSGRRMSVNGVAAETACRLLLEGEHGGAAGVARELMTRGLTNACHDKSTIIRAAKRAAAKNGTKITAVKGKPRRQLAAATKKKRLAFAKRYLNFQWRGVMFTDRKNFRFCYPGQCVGSTKWVKKGQKWSAWSPNHPNQVNVYMGISEYGVTKVHVVAGTTSQKSTYKNKKNEQSKNITQAEYHDVLNQTLLPGGARIFSQQGMSSWILQQDNDPAHGEAGPSIEKYNTRRGTRVQLLKFWPPSSPDLNPIENVWAWAQRRVNARGCKTFAEFQQAVIDTLQSVPPQMLKGLVRSMPKRLAKVLENDGEKTGY